MDFIIILDLHLFSVYLKLIKSYNIFHNTSHAETVVQLVRKKPDAYIDITVDMDELDLTASEAKATYQEIKDWC